MTPGDPDSGFASTLEEHANQVVVATLTGELDITSAEELRRRFSGLRVGEPCRVVVDLRGLSFIDSSGLNALVTIARAVEENGGAVTFAGANEHISRVFEIVRFGDSVPIEASFDTALQRAEREASALG